MQSYLSTECHFLGRLLGKWVQFFPRSKYNFIRALPFLFQRILLRNILALNSPVYLLQTLLRYQYSRKSSYRRFISPHLKLEMVIVISCLDYMYIPLPSILSACSLSLAKCQYRTPLFFLQSTTSYIHFRIKIHLVSGPFINEYAFFLPGLPPPHWEEIYFVFIFLNYS